MQWSPNLSTENRLGSHQSRVVLLLANSAYSFLRERYFHNLCTIDKLYNLNVCIGNRNVNNSAMKKKMAGGDKLRMKTTHKLLTKGCASAIVMQVVCGCVCVRPRHCDQINYNNGGRILDLCHELKRRYKE